MDNIFEFVGKIVVAVGGAGVLITGISIFLSKFWADWFMKRKTANTIFPNPFVRVALMAYL